MSVLTIKYSHSNNYFADYLVAQKQLKIRTSRESHLSKSCC